MGFLDDNGPFTNMMVNQALFKFPSTRPPGEVAGEIGPVLAVVGAAALIGLGGYAAYRAIAPGDSAAVTPHVQIDRQSGHRLSFAEFNRTPKDGQVENVRPLAELYDTLGALLTTQGSPHAVNVTASQDALMRLSVSDTISEKPGLVVIHSYLPKISECSSRKLSTQEEGEISLVRGMLKEVLFEITYPG